MNLPSRLECLKWLGSRIILADGRFPAELRILFFWGSAGVWLINLMHPPATSKTTPSPQIKIVRGFREVRRRLCQVMLTSCTTVLESIRDWDEMSLAETRGMKGRLTVRGKLDA
ncbi:hypothetical protein BDZ45DRAFT_140719 [Acephala macrosclerotiorum]|nr:hypothetical protein BDZ45DRAFT_140719 [Acephala macrosclerotiorum]